jgi:hypothetical protein
LPFNPNGRGASPGFLPFYGGFFGKPSLSIALSLVVGQQTLPE